MCVFCVWEKEKEEKETKKQRETWWNVGGVKTHDNSSGGLDLMLNEWNSGISFVNNWTTHGFYKTLMTEHQGQKTTNVSNAPDHVVDFNTAKEMQKKMNKVSTLVTFMF